MADERKPWDQQEGEDAAAYYRFCVYLFLGPSRSINRAYEAAMREVDSEPKSAPGIWRRNSVEYRWVERSRQFDISMLQERGQAGVLALVDAVTEAAQKLALAFRDLPGPATWEEAVKGLAALGNVIPAGAVEGMLDSSRNER